jgi:hypothetical protein
MGTRNMQTRKAAGYACKALSDRDFICDEQINV